VTTTTLERPAELRSRGAGGAVARRAVVRWAWRLFRHEWRQQMLVLTMITIAVAATILGGAIATNTPPPAHAGFGSADHLVNFPASSSHLASDLRRIEQHFGTVEVIENREITTGLG
jgi:putative ABC transport system permease protein